MVDRGAVGETYRRVGVGRNVSAYWRGSVSACRSGIRAWPVLLFQAKNSRILASTKLHGAIKGLSVKVISTSSERIS
jgi:hypothetical protein